MRACVRYPECFLLFSSTGAQDARYGARALACLQHPNEAHGVAQPCPRGFAPVLTGAIWAAAAELLPAVRQLADRYDAQGTRRRSTGKGTKAPLSAIHRRSFPSLKAGYTVDAHIEALVDEGDVASSFVPGHCSRRKAPRTAKYISLHLSYRRPGVQPSPSLGEIVLDFGTCEVMNNMQYIIWRYDSPAMGDLDADEAELICAAQIADFLSLPARVVAPPWMRHMGWAGELVEEVD